MENRVRAARIGLMTIASAMIALVTIALVTIASVTIASVTIGLPGLAAAQDEKRQSPLPTHLPLGKEICYGRVYDAVHLKAHPKQRVTSFHLFRDFTPDANKEKLQETREALIAGDGSDGGVVAGRRTARPSAAASIATAAASC
jgi:hypothetical protein